MDRAGRVALRAAVVDPQFEVAHYIDIADSRAFGIARKPGREELLKHLRAFRGRLPADFKFDREEANAR